VAALGAEYGDRLQWFPPRGVPPWLLAEVARVSLVLGTEFNRSPATRADVIDCANAYLQLNDPDLARHDPDALGEFLLRTSGEQLVYQQEVFHDLSRTIALFQRTPRPATRPAKVAVEGWDQELFGCSLSDYSRIAFLLYVGALKNSGRFDPAWLDQPNFRPVTEVIPASVFQIVLERNFVADRETLRAAQKAIESRVGMPAMPYRRFGFNPLTRYPLVSGLADHWYVPVPHLLIRKASPAGVFYAGMDRWGKDWADDIGPLFEAYIGEQLRELGGLVFAEIEFGPARSRQRSVDWIVVFEECVLLVEAKSVRPTEPIRWGGPDAVPELERMLAKGVGQLGKSARLIAERHRAFEDIPTDRPIIGLVATMEPFHVINTPFLAMSLPDSSIPYRICSAEELEGLVGLRDERVGRTLIDYLADPERNGHSIKPLIEDRPLARNRLLDEAWQSAGWPDQDEEQAASRSS
jgi:hypothetical protein